MKRLLFIHSYYSEYGGEDSVVDDELKFLKDYFHLESLLFFNKSNTITKAINTLNSSNTNYFSLSKLKKAVEEFKPEIVYIHNLWFSASLGLLDYLNEQEIPVIVKIHNLKVTCSIGTNYREGSLCHECSVNNKEKAIEYRCYKNSKTLTKISNRFGDSLFYKLNNFENIKKIIVLSPFHIDYFSFLGFDRNKLVISHNGVEIPKQYNTNPSNSKNLIYLGRLTQDKGILDLVEAMRISNNDFHLDVYGTGALLEKLQNLNLDNVTFHGFKRKQEIFKQFLNTRAVVFPTRLYEGQGMVPVEAGAYGVPTVSPNLGGMKQLYPEENYFMYQPFSIENLIEKIDLLKDDQLVNEQGLKNREHIVNNFQKERTVKHLVGLLEKYI